MVEINLKLLDEDVHAVACLPLPWNKLENKTVLISGAGGMIGSFLIRVFMARKEKINIVAVGRSEEKAKKSLGEFWDRDDFKFISQDIRSPLMNIGKIDYMIHAASNTHPKAYSTDPVGTITTNVIGLTNMLDYAVANKIERFLFASSVEVYGENRGDVERFDETYDGYIDCNTVRAGYCESKRVGESLCQSYHAQYDIDVVIARIPRTYGPTMLETDTKAISQFIKNGINHEDIVLKSKGTQLFSYSYVADTVSGILTILLKGETCGAYNIADEFSEVSLKSLAELIARTVGTNVVYQIPDEIEAAGYSKATKALMNSDKLKNLGWSAQWTIDSGISRTLSILKKGI